METELIQSLKDVGYAGPLLDLSKFSDAIQGGAESPEFTTLVSWITDEIGSFEKFDETVHPTSSPDDANSFLLELNMFLQELQCTNKKLTTGNLSERLVNIEQKTGLLEYLIIELITSKLLKTKKTENNKTVEITINESIIAKSMREMITALTFSKPLDDITLELLFKKLHTKVTEIIKKVPKELIGKALFFGELNNDQWEKLAKIQANLNEEYTIRREMLLKRLDVTINSFLWSGKLKSKADELNKCYNVKRNTMKHKPDVTLAHLLASRDDLAIIEKTSNASVCKNTRSSVNSVIIGSVPDRGGRPNEQEAPPPEIPSWQKNKVHRSQGGGFSRGGCGYSGGRTSNQGEKSFRDNKSVASNFGQNFNNSQQLSDFRNQNFSFRTQTVRYSQQNSGYTNQSSNYESQSSTGYNNQISGYGGNQSSSGYDGQSSSGYSNQNIGYGNQGGYDRRSGGDYNKGGQNRSNRVQGSWNQGSDTGSSNYNRGAYNNRYQGQGGGRRY